MDGQFPQDGHRHIIIVGGGASGVLAAAHLLRNDPFLRISMIEKSHSLGCGIAYSTDDPGHLLNTRVHNMSAFPDDPEHFLRWLHSSGEAPEATADCFAGRTAYGRYLENLLTAWGGDRLTCHRQECLRIEEKPGCVRACLEDGSAIMGHLAILATGHAVPQHPPKGMRGGWDFAPPADSGADVVIIGTGLSMVDHVVTLLGRGHRGSITCLSRRGLLPRAHAASRAMAIARDEIPLGAPVSRVLHWLRARIRQAEAEGLGWRDVLDGLRPHVSAIWQGWDEDSRRRFLRHAASWWEVHRHRMPPQSAALIADAQARGQLHVLRARFERLADEDVHVLTPEGPHLLPAGHVIDCRGIRRDPETDSSPVVLDLIATGQGRLDPLRLGLDTTREARLIARDGRVSSRLFAIGPCARAALWEITAIPDIRVQCARLAELLDRLPESVG
ncbi:FAD/NAD(P)-binding protein (plasmid) [Paracoccus denitrificans]|uniref:FAD/NAD(P)-binding protein n=1 Tax=Paracoccus denitrificans TaxID=266 RepID=UPI001E4E0A23|nr:FAD/NAD(P)-binding protein [Paracoccus denitrificans]UFS67929.1 FAD/NAD(P)-binding protein [Paracoccus denitrificans]